MYQSYYEYNTKLLSVGYARELETLITFVLLWYQNLNMTNVFYFIFIFSMAPSDSSTSESLSSTNTTVPTSSLITNLPHLVTVKLTRDNFLLWKAQIVPYLKGQKVFG